MCFNNMHDNLVILETQIRHNEKKLGVEWEILGKLVVSHLLNIQVLYMTKNQVNCAPKNVAISLLLLLLLQWLFLLFLLTITMWQFNKY